MLSPDLDKNSELKSRAPEVMYPPRAIKLPFKSVTGMKGMELITKLYAFLLSIKLYKLII